MTSVHYRVFLWEIKTFYEINISMTYGKLYSFLQAELPRYYSIIFQFLETRRYINVLIPINSILNSLSKQLFSEIPFFYL